MTTRTEPRRLLMLDPMPRTEVDFINSLLPVGTFHVTAPDPDDGSALASLLNDAEILVTRTQPVTKELLSNAPNLKFVQKYGGRPDRLELDAARDAGIQVALMPLSGCIAVAELTLTLILALSKQLVEAHQATVTGAYRELDIEPFETNQRAHAFQWMKLPNLQEIRGKRLGVVGFGEIGTEVAKRAQAFEMDVVYYKREPLPTWLDELLGVTPLSLDEVLSTSDFVTLHVPHSDATHRMIGSRELQLMKQSAYLVNTCRGPVVDEAALIEALKTRTIAGAGLDVFDYEPLPFDSPLVELDNVILTPHIGGGTGGAREKQMKDVLSNVVRFARGELVLHQIV